MQCKFIKTTKYEPRGIITKLVDNKLAVSSNSMNKLRDYFLVPTTEEVQLDEKAGDMADLRNLVGELVKASGMHLAQSKKFKLMLT